jgi:hypothetical protein
MRQAEFSLTGWIKEKAPDNGGNGSYAQKSPGDFLPIDVTIWKAIAKTSRLAS